MLTTPKSHSRTFQLPSPSSALNIERSWTVPTRAIPPAGPRSWAVLFGGYKNATLQSRHGSYLVEEKQGRNPMEYGIIVWLVIQLSLVG